MILRAALPLLLSVSVLTAQSAPRTPSSAANAGVPHVLKFSGSVAAGADASHAGAVGIVFSIYAEQTGGAPLWLENQNVSPDANGRYSVILGAVNELPAELFAGNQARWLGVQVVADAEPEQPRVMLVSVPYALKAQDAETLGGRPASAYLRAESLAALLRDPKEKSAPALESEGNVFTTDPHTVGAIPKFSATDTLVDSILKETLVGAEQRIGIGVGATPTARLEVNGNVAATGFLAGATRFLNPTAGNYKFFEYTPPQATSGKFNGAIQNFPIATDPAHDNWVMTLGYNQGAGGTRENASLPALQLGWESHYAPTSGVSAQLFHLQHMTASGSTQRAISFYKDSTGLDQLSLNTSQLIVGNGTGSPRAYLGQAGQFDWYLGHGVPDGALVPVLRVFRGFGITDAYIKFQKGTALDYWRIGSGFYVTQTNGNIGVNVLPNANTSAVIRSTSAIDGLDIVGAAPLFNLRVRNASGFNAFRVTNTQVDISNGLAFRLYSGNLTGEVATILPTGAATFAGQVHSTSGGFRFPDGTVQTTAATGGYSLPADPVDCAIGQYAQAIDAFGNLACSSPGTNTQLLFNDSGLLSGDSGLTFNKTSNMLTATGGYKVGLLELLDATSTSGIVGRITPTQAGAPKAFITHASFPQGYACGVNADNQVLRIGHNQTPGGGPSNESLPMVALEFESQWCLTPTPDNYTPEVHLVVRNPGGSLHRIWTAAVPKDTDLAHLGMNVDKFYISDNAPTPVQRVIYGSGTNFAPSYVNSADNATVVLGSVDRNVALAGTAKYSFQKNASLDYWNFGAVRFGYATGQVALGTVNPQAGTMLHIPTTASIDGVDVTGATNTFHLRTRDGSAHYFRTSASTVDLANGLDLKMWSGNLAALVFDVDGATGDVDSAGTIDAATGFKINGAITDDTVMVNNGTATQLKAIADCDTTRSALTYDTTTNAFGCNSMADATADSISVAGSAATDADFIDLASTGTEAGVDFTLDTGPTPDTISGKIAGASGTMAGVVTTGAQTFAGIKTFASPIVGNIDTASALAANPTDCTEGQYAKAIDASGNLTCSAIQASEVPSLSGNYVDLTGAQTISGAKSFSSPASFSRIDLPATSAANSGVIAVAGDPWIHTFGINNFFIGHNAGNFAMTGEWNIGIGDYALSSNAAGQGNIAVGVNVLAVNTTGFGNVGFGTFALNENVTGNGNVAVGPMVLYKNNSGSYNTATGFHALWRNSTGDENTVSGRQALYENQSGSKNTAMGVAALITSNADGNTGLGYRSLRDNMTGSYNTALGAYSGGVADGSEAGNVSGSYNTFIGYQARPMSLDFVNATALGANATVGRSNAVVLGDLAVNVGIGTSYPNAKLQVSGGDVAVTTQSNGVILRATDGPNCFRVTVNNAGTLATASVACP